MAFCVFLAHCSATLRTPLSSLTPFHPAKLLRPSHLVARLSMHTMSLAMLLPRCRSLAWSESALRPAVRFTWTGLSLQSMGSHHYNVANPKLGRGEGCGRQQGHAYATRREASEVAFASESEGASFLADPSITWRSLGLSEEVAQALVQAALLQPSLVQAASIPLILSTKDVILAAETGSGKTHAYLAPLIQKLHETPEEVIEVENQTGKKSTRRPRHFGLVMCPNALLCQQVADMANVLQSTGGDPLIRVVVVCGGQGWPSSLPDLVVATPAALMNNLFAFDADRRRRSAFVRDVRYVVLDEADMLLGGGFVRQVGRLIDLFRLEEKRKFKDMELEKVQERRRKQEELDSRKDYTSATEADDDMVAAKEEDEVFLRSDWTEEQDEHSMATDSDQVDSVSGRQAEMYRRNEWLRARKEYKRSKQYIFVAATLPQGGKLSPGALLKQKFRNASWVNGHLLHRQNPRLEHRWLEVTEDKRIPALIDAVSERGRLDNFESMGRTLVFANSVESVDAIGRVLERAGFRCMRYHRDLSLNERTEALQVFEQNGGLLICTDSAARGLDIPNISHVMQAEFATSAVDFLHRIGRTARAGQPGLVTSLYTAANRNLVEAVQETVTLSLPVEGAFSCKRSFRRKIKKYGSFQGLV